MLVMKIQQEVNGENVDGLTYHYFDVIADKYSSQDNLQALSIITAIIDLIHTDFTAVTELMLGSDNESCLASHDNIPYV